MSAPNCAASSPSCHWVSWSSSTTAGAVVEAEYLTEILDAPLARQLLDHFVVLLEAALADPDQALRSLPLMGADDADWLRAVSAGEQFDTPASTLPALVEAQVARTPDAVAVVYEGRAVQLPRDQRGRESPRALADRTGNRHRGPGRRAPRQVPATRHRRAGDPQGGRRLPTGRPDLSRGPVAVHPRRLRSETRPARSGCGSGRLPRRQPRRR